MAEEKEKLILADRKHPLYKDNENLWDFYDDASNGGHLMISHNYLFSHRLEDTEDHDERIERAYYLNFCDTIPKIFNSYIFKEQIQRPSDRKLESFRKNVDGRGTDIHSFVKRAGYISSVFGIVHALLDVENPTSKNRASIRDIENGTIFPYSTLFNPLQIVDWSVDRFGNLNWIVIRSINYIDENPEMEREEQDLYRLITKEISRIEDGDGNPVPFENGEMEIRHNLGFVPIISMYHEESNSEMIGESMIKDIAYVNRTILNWCSCIDEQIERQTFSQLTVPDDGTLANEEEEGNTPLYRLGTGSIFTFPADSGQPPQFISPDVANLQIIWRLVLDHVKEIFRMAGLLGGTGDMYASRSGRASQIGFQSVNSALAEKAASYQKFENGLGRMALRMIGESPDKYQDVKYPDKFDVAALSDEINSFFKIMKANFSETLNKEIQKNISRRSLPLAPLSVREQIETEIDEGDGTIKGVPDDEPIGEDGNPNVNRISDKFRSTEDKEFDEHNKGKKE